MGHCAAPPGLSATLDGFPQLCCGLRCVAPPGLSEISRDDFPQLALWATFVSPLGGFVYFLVMTLRSVVSAGLRACSLETNPIHRV
jgi:hypothetical protein